MKDKTPKKAWRTAFVLLSGLGFGFLCYAIYYSYRPNPEDVSFAIQINAPVDEVVTLRDVSSRVDSKSYRFPEDVDALENLVRSKNDTIQFSACRLLGFVGKIGEKDRCSDALYNVAMDGQESDNVRFKALHALDKLDHEKAISVAKAQTGALGEKFENAVKQLLQGERVDFSTAVNLKDQGT